MNPVETIDEQIMFYYSTYGKTPDSITMGYEFYNDFINHIIETNKMYLTDNPTTSEYKGIPVYRSTIVYGKGSNKFVLGELL